MLELFPIDAFVTKHPDSFHLNQTCYEATYAPDNQLTLRHRIVWSHIKIVNKEQILSMMDEAWPGQIHYKDEGFFKLAWLNNEPPSENKWNAAAPGQQLLLSLRISPLIEAPGRIALLAFYTAKV